MTITLDGQNELPLHPLDLTTEPDGQPNSQYCTGLIQTDPSLLSATSDIGDMILGVPFMRNVYTVMAYEPPDASGNFNNSVPLGTSPTLGLLGLTNATQAMEEFDQVRVLKQPSGSASSQQSASTQTGDAQPSVGVKVLIGLVGFFVLCLALCTLRCIFTRRRWRRTSPAARDESGMDQIMEYGAYRNAGSRTRSSVVEDIPDPEFGTWKSKLDDLPTEQDLCAPWELYSYADTWRDTIVGTDAGKATSHRSSSSYFPRDDDPDELHLHSPDSPELTSALLTAHDRSDSQTSSDLAEVEMGALSMGTSMTGIGTAARGSIIDALLQHDRSSYDSVTSRPTTSSSRSSHTPAS